jgi:hypothetical protein
MTDGKGGAMVRTTALVAALCLLAACGNAATTPGGEVGVEEVPVVTGPLNPYADPPDYEGDPFAGFPVVTGLSVPDYSDFADDQEILSGSHFTIQIGAATSEEAATMLAELATDRMSLPVFVDHLDSFWKVRVGAFASRMDAVNMLATVAGLGYPDAWVTTREP